MVCIRIHSIPARDSKESKREIGAITGNQS